GGNSAPKVGNVLGSHFLSSLENETAFGISSKQPSYSLLFSNHHIHTLARRAKSSRGCGGGHIGRRILADAVFQRHHNRLCGPKSTGMFPQGCSLAEPGTTYSSEEQWGADSPLEMDAHSGAARAGRKQRASPSRSQRA